MLFSFFLLTSLCLSCFCEESSELVCYEFDERQCSGDDWSDEVPIDKTKSEREADMKAYLSSKGISVDQVNLVIDFHDAVCEACFICPEEDRFFIRFEEEDLPKLEELDLLNFAKVECEEVF
jgi:hypothetical protein